KVRLKTRPIWPVFIRNITIDTSAAKNTAVPGFVSQAELKRALSPFGATFCVAYRVVMAVPGLELARATAAARPPGAGGSRGSGGPAAARSAVRGCGGASGWDWRCNVGIGIW